MHTQLAWASNTGPLGLLWRQAGSISPVGVLSGNAGGRKTSSRRRAALAATGIGMSGMADGMPEDLKSSLVLQTQAYDLFYKLYGISGAAHRAAFSEKDHTAQQ